MTSITRFFIPKTCKEDSEEYIRSALFINVFLLTGVISFLLVPLGIYISYEKSLIVMPLGALAFLINAWLLKTGASHFTTGNLFTLIASTMIIVMMMYSGGIYSPVTPWIAAGPTFALLLVSRKAAWFWTGYMLVVVSIFAWIEIKGFTPAPEYNPGAKTFYYTTVYSSLILVILTINLIFEKNKNDALLKVQAARKSITDSINYARRIQNAMLPSDIEIKDLFKECFVLHKPKDIISGDFYWMTESNGKKFVAAADCTGHGVPGALMSMVGNEILNKIVFEKNFQMWTKSSTNCTTTCT